VPSNFNGVLLDDCRLHSSVPRNAESKLGLLWRRNYDRTKIPTWYQSTDNGGWKKE
jgi:hypothetical protein